MLSDSQPRLLEKLEKWKRSLALVLQQMFPDLAKLTFGELLDWLLFQWGARTEGHCQPWDLNPHALPPVRHPIGPPTVSTRIRPTHPPLFGTATVGHEPVLPPARALGAPTTTRCIRIRQMDLPPDLVSSSVGSGSLTQQATGKLLELRKRRLREIALQSLEYCSV